MNENQLEGKVKQTRGRMKEVAGNILGDKTMETKGRIRDVTGKIQEVYGDLQKDLEKGG